MTSVPGSTRSSVFVLAEALPERWRTVSRPGGLWSAGLPFSGGARVGARGISQVSWRSFPYLCPALRPRPDQQDLAIRGLADAAPRPNTPKAPART